MERRSLRRQTDLLERGLTTPDLDGIFVGESVEFRHLFHLIDRVAPSEPTVLITRETGSGNERVTPPIHARGARRLRPFVLVDLRIPGREPVAKGTLRSQARRLTGADRGKPGLFDVAHGGTIFLDEIGEISPSTPTKLLRVLDTSVFRHLGGIAEILVDVRVVAATNRICPRWCGRNCSVKISTTE